MPEIDVTGDLDGQEIWIVRLLSLAGFSSSNREARQLVEQGAVSIDGVRITDPSAQIRPAHGSVLKVGRRRFARISVD
jgi:tyrosyl-tRNA synthetase